MEQTTYVKAVFTALFAFFTSLLGVLAVPVLLMVGCNIVDYITGLMACNYRDQKISSYKSIKGIMKKISMWLLVIVGAFIDELLHYTCDVIDLNVPFTFLISCIVAIWIVCNEIISILENIKDMGIAIPIFLEPLIRNIKSQVEDLGGAAEDEAVDVDDHTEDGK